MKYQDFLCLLLVHRFLLHQMLHPDLDLQDLQLDQLLQWDLVLLGYHQILVLRLRLKKVIDS